jgi:hypothetical protein
VTIAFPGANMPGVCARAVPALAMIKIANATNANDVENGAKKIPARSPKRPHRPRRAQ